MTSGPFSKLLYCHYCYISPYNYIYLYHRFLSKGQTKIRTMLQIHVMIHATSPWSGLGVQSSPCFILTLYLYNNSLVMYEIIHLSIYI